MKSGACCAAAAALSATLWAADNPGPAQLLRESLGPPSVSYQGKMMVTHWYGKNTRAEEVVVEFSPPNRFRWEYLKPDGTHGRVVVSDGKDERVRLSDNSLVLKGNAAKSVPKRMSEDSEWNLLEKNYVIALTGSGPVCGRDTWILQLTPHADGKLSERLWIDKATGVILENKRFRPDGEFVVLSRFNQFKTVDSLPDSLFQLSTDTGVPEEDHNFEPDFLSFEELKEDTGRSANLPEALPAGFIFESADTFTVDGKNVDHVRYTDGLSVLSIFETSKPVRLPAHRGSPQVRPGAVQIIDTGSVLQTKSGSHHYTLMSDVSEPLLKAISASLK